MSGGAAGGPNANNLSAGPLGNGMHGPSTNLSGSTPSTIKSSKKKSSSIDKKNTSTTIHSGNEILKKTIPKKGII